MNTQVKVIKCIVGVVGFFSFIAALGMVGNIEQNVGNDIANVIMAFLFNALTALCVWLNNKIDQAFDSVDF